MLYKIKDNKLIIIINIFWFLIALFLNYKMPYVVDDFDFMKSKLDGELITDISQILPSAWAWCHQAGGRFITYVLATYMIFLPKAIFNIINAIVYVLKVNLISEYVAFYGKSTGVQNQCAMKAAILSILYLLCWFFTPDFADVSFWISGSIGYSWTSCVVLGFGLIYYRSFLRKRSRCQINSYMWFKEICRDVGIFLLGFWAGFSAETSACTLAAALLIYFLWNKKNHCKIERWEWIGGFAVVAGLLLLLLMPGNYNRMEYVRAASVSGNILLEYMFRFARITYYTLRCMTAPVAISVFLFFISPGKKRGSEEYFFWFLAFLSIYTMLFAAAFTMRIYLFPLLLVFIATGISFQRIMSGTENESRECSRIRKGVLCFSLILLLLIMTEIISGILYAREEGEYFDRVMFYHHVEESTDGVLPGDGMRFSDSSTSGGIGS